MLHISSCCSCYSQATFDKTRLDNLSLPGKPQSYDERLMPYMPTYMHAYMHACMHAYIHTYMLSLICVSARLFLLHGLGTGECQRAPWLQGFRVPQLLMSLFWSCI